MEMPGLGGAGEGGFHDPMDASVSEETGKVYTAGGSSQVCGLEPPVLMAPTMATTRSQTTKLSGPVPVVGGFTVPTVELPSFAVPVNKAPPGAPIDKPDVGFRVATKGECRPAACQRWRAFGN